MINLPLLENIHLIQKKQQQPIEHWTLICKVFICFKNALKWRDERLLNSKILQMLIWISPSRGIIENHALHWVSTETWALVCAANGTELNRWTLWPLLCNYVRLCNSLDRCVQRVACVNSSCTASASCRCHILRAGCHAACWTRSVTNCNEI